MQTTSHRHKIEGTGSDNHVIARPQAVAISWYAVQIRTMSQEIATPFGLAMTW